MSVKVRRVPFNWEHPKDKRGHYIPTFEHFPYEGEDIDDGLREGSLTNEPPNYGLTVMPQWPDSERTHYQMYEDVTEGTPISPVMETPEELARWLVQNGATSVAYQTETYDGWMALIQGKYRPRHHFRLHSS